ncbi:MAG: 50S ribosomal protein L22 [Muribaculaceae bacterium]|jgi:large subunit ribosomal protein L22|nr:50S ribosomal protein L22 [Muribaculaceae bacterium]HAP51235.1 50S ribosomal protein L22 [Porphyromonadaceae bacterium]
MGNRKKKSAELMKEARKSQSFAKLRNIPSSPRKMRLVADMVRGKEVFKALGLLHFSNKQAAADIEKLLKSAISNWEQKNGKKAESGELYIKTIFVDAAPMLKRLRPAPQGRGYRIRKRSNHVTLFVDTINTNEKDA